MSDSEQAIEPAIEPVEEVVLREVLKERGMSNNDIKQAALAGKVMLRGMPTSDMGRMVIPSEVEHVSDARRITPGRDLVILHRDPNMVVVSKPSGMLSVHANNQKDKPDVVSFVGKLFDKGYAVHRLDQETSGAMMIALDEDSQYRIKELLEVHDVERRYLAIVQGRPGKSQWKMDTQLVRNRGDGKRGTGEADNAKRAITHFKVIQPLRGATLVEAMLETGRTHQVRIHLAEAGHPVLGDKLYGNQGSARRFPRVALHAAILGFDHPSTQLKMRFDVPLADDMEKLRRELTRPEAREFTPGDRPRSLSPRNKSGKKKSGKKRTRKKVKRKS